MQQAGTTKLTRHLGLLGLAATGICSMIGASIYVVPFMIQRNVPGIGPYVLPAFLFAAIPAVLAAFAYAMLSSAMPRAGGSYIFASRGLHPYLGFVASFSQWFGLSIVIGVISYVVVPFLRDIAYALDLNSLAEFLNTGVVRVSIALVLLWCFVWVNVLGVQIYVKALIPLMLLMFGLGLIVIFTGFYFNHDDFKEASAQGSALTNMIPNQPFSWKTFLAAAAILFSSFIGFDAIAQAGGEAKNPQKMLPRAIAIAIVGVGVYYFTFTSAVYHTVPWQYVAQQAIQNDVTATGLLQPVIPFVLGIIITAGAAIALINDLPAMLLSVSRLIFAWASDGIFPKKLGSVHTKYKTPHKAIFLSGIMASIGILGSHFAGDFFLGIDIMVLSMLINFLLMCITVITIKSRNYRISQDIRVIPKRPMQLVLAWLGVLFLSGFIIVHVSKDLTASVSHWYFRSTPIWLIVMGIGSLIFLFQFKSLKSKGVDTKRLFDELPEE